MLTAAAYRRGQGLEPLDPRPDLGYAANHLWMITGTEPAPEHVRARRAVPHPHRRPRLQRLDLHRPGRRVHRRRHRRLRRGRARRPLRPAARRCAEPRARRARRDRHAGERPPPGSTPGRRAATGSWGSGTRSTEQGPPLRCLRETRRELGGRAAELAVAVEQSVIDAARRAASPDRTLRANVEFYAGVVMDECGLPREMFTPTFAVSRVDGLVRPHPRAGARAQDHPTQCPVCGSAPSAAGPAPGVPLSPGIRRGRQRSEFRPLSSGLARLPRVDRARPEPQALGVLLHRVGQPADHPAQGEHRLAAARPEPARLDQRGQPEVDVGAQRVPAADRQRAAPRRPASPSGSSRATWSSSTSARGSAST